MAEQPSSPPVLSPEGEHPLLSTPAPQGARDLVSSILHPPVGQGLCPLRDERDRDKLRQLENFFDSYDWPT